MSNDRTIAVNRRARHEFAIDDSLEAGIVLTGTEIKSIRAGKVNLADSFARINRDEAWLVGAHIAPWEGGNRENHEPKRDRKLLPWVQAFNPYDLYTKSHERPDMKELRPFYDELIREFLPGELRW